MLSGCTPEVEEHSSFGMFYEDGVTGYLDPFDGGVGMFCFVPTTVPATTLFASHSM